VLEHGARNVHGLLEHGRHVTFAPVFADEIAELDRAVAIPRLQLLAYDLAHALDELVSLGLTKQHHLLLGLTCGARFQLAVLGPCHVVGRHSVRVLALAQVRDHLTVDDDGSPLAHPRTVAPPTDRSPAVRDSRATWSMNPVASVT
jgi:hypothetical protein